MLLFLGPRLMSIVVRGNGKYPEYISFTTYLTLWTTYGVIETLDALEYHVLNANTTTYQVSGRHKAVLVKSESMSVQKDRLEPVPWFPSFSASF